MMPNAYPRRIASFLLRTAMRAAPHDALDWGHAMLNELNHVQGDWAALLWAIGGAHVLAKQALLSLVFPSRNRSPIPFGRALFSKEGPMRKPVLAAIVACVAATLLFFLAPVFRQAFRISLLQWHDLLHVQLNLGYRDPDPELEKLARKAEQNRDAEGLAFVAVRTPSRPERIRLADEAVRLDSRLTWVYAVVANPCPPNTNIDSWIDALEKFDPQNALPHLMVVEQIDIDEELHESVPRRTEDRPAAWQDAMAAAFRSPKLDAYLDRLKQLDRHVLARYRINDPSLITEYTYGFYGLPTYAASDSSRYAELLFKEAQALEEKGDFKSASEKYLAVARFGQMMGPRGGFFLQEDLQEGYRRLEALSEKTGSKEGAAFYASLADQTAKAEEQEHASWRNRFAGGDLSRWNGFLARLSGFVLLLSSALLLACLLAHIVRQRSVKLSPLHLSWPALTIGLTAGITLLLSSAVLYASYRPYAGILQRFVQTGDDQGIAELSDFLTDVQVPLGAESFRSGFGFVFYFWFGVTVLCVLSLLLLLLPRLIKHLRPKGAT